MFFIAKNVEIIRVKDEFKFNGGNCRGINVVILVPMKVKGKEVEKSELFYKVYKPELIREIKNALMLGFPVDIEGHLLYSRYSPKGVINTITNTQHSQGQFDFIITKVKINEDPEA